MKLHRPLLPCSIVVLCLGLAAQTTPAFTSPSGFVSKSGAAFSSPFTMSFWNARVQVIDYDLPQSKVTLSRLEYRTTTAFTYTSTSRLGRSYTNLRLTLATAQPKPTGTFANNFRTRGTVVYNARFSTPTLTTARPRQLWGNTMSLPFTTYMHDGSNPLLTEWNLAGGRLHNGYAAASGRVRAVDGALVTKKTIGLFPNSATARGSVFLPGGPVRGSASCSDSSQTATFADAYSYLFATIFADNYDTKALRGMLKISQSRGYWGQPGGSHLGVLSLAGTDQGVTISGAKCQKLYVNPAFALSMTGRTADSKGQTDGHLPTSSIRYDNRWAGSAIYFQFAFEDSKTRQLGLSRACKIVLPKTPNPVASAEAVIYRFRNGSVWSPANAATGFVAGTRQTTPIKGWSRK